MVTKGYGISIKDIDEGCPKDFEPYEFAHVEEVKEQDKLQYNMGYYIVSAVSMVAANMFSKNGKNTYFKKPLLSYLDEQKEEISSDNVEFKARIEMELRGKVLKDMGMMQSPV